MQGDEGEFRGPIDRDEQVELIFCCAQLGDGQVERMNRTIKEPTVNRYHYESHKQLRTHLVDFVTAYNFARRLKILKGLSPYEYICNAWTKEPARFNLDPIHQMPGRNT